MYSDPCNYHFVLLWRKRDSKKFSVGDRVNPNISLEFSMDVRHVMFVYIIEEHPYQDVVKH